MGIMAYSLLWVMQDLYHQPLLSVQQAPVAFKGMQGFGQAQHPISSRGSNTWLSWPELRKIPRWITQLNISQAVGRTLVDCCCTCNGSLGLSYANSAVDNTAEYIKL